MKKKKGFSLIELLTVMAVIAVLVLIAAPRYLNYTKDAKVKHIEADVKTVNDVLAGYMLRNADNLPPGGADITAAAVKPLVDNKKVYNATGVITQIDETADYTVIDGVLLKERPAVS